MGIHLSTALHHAIIRAFMRFVHSESGFTQLAAMEKSLIVATIEVQNVQALFDEYKQSSVEFPQCLIRQTWGSDDFQIRDVDGNVISFVEYRQ